MDIYYINTGGTRNWKYGLSTFNPVLCDKRRKLTQASKAKKIIYKDRK